MTEHNDSDRTSFEENVLPHLDIVFRAAMTLCRNRQEAEDLTQATFARALERFETFTPGTNCKAWLLRILKNLFRDRLRHRKVVGTMVSVEEGDLPGRESAEETVSVDASDILENFSDEHVINALKELPDEQRLALFLADVAELSHDEIAETMDVAVGTVKSRTSRARAALKKKLLARGKEMGWTGRKR